MKVRGLLVSIFLALLVGCGGGTENNSSPEIENNSLPEIYEVRDASIGASSSNVIRGKLTDAAGKTDGYEFVVVANPHKGTLALNSNGSFVYTPSKDASGGDQFTYSVRDAIGRSNVGMIKIDANLMTSCLATQETLLSAEFKVEENQTAVITTIGELQQAAGFVAEISAYDSSTSARRMLNAIIERINSQVTVINTISEQKTFFTVDSISGQYLLTYSPTINTSSLELNNALYRAITDDVESELPTVIQDAVAASSFRLWATVMFNNPDSVLVVLGVVSEEEYPNFAVTLDTFADGGNIAPCGSEILSNSDQFVAEEVGSNLADFLFVVDNSGTMADKQVAIQEAANLFVNTIEDAGLDYQMGVITTENDQLRGSGFTADIETFKTDVVVGAEGDVTETGIYFAERALSSKELGDSIDGTVTNAGYPREGASLSVIIISDEESQYSRRAFSGFDVNNNLFVERNYRVYSIVREYDEPHSQYDDLAFATGGAVASISETSTFPAIMEQIATNSGGASSRYVLTGKPVSSTIVVRVDGNEIIRSRDNGWQYIALSNSIVFYGESIPDAGADIVVDYSSITESSGVENLN